MNDARRKLDDLGKELKSYKDKEQRINSDYAWGSDKFTLAGELSYPGGRTCSTWELTIPWTDIFVQFSHDLLHEESVSERKMARDLAKVYRNSKNNFPTFVEKPQDSINEGDERADKMVPEGNSTASDPQPSFYRNNFDLVMAQFEIHNLVERSEGKVRLTPFGRSHLVEVTAMKKKTATIPSPGQNALERTVLNKEILPSTSDESKQS